MSHSFPRPGEPFLSVDRVPVDGACPDCGAIHLAPYPVMSEERWWRLVKCQVCPGSITRPPGPLFGVYVPLGLRITGSRG